jgi:nicotinate-nucleotide pyrophosphorylase
MPDAFFDAYDGLVSDFVIAVQVATVNGPANRLLLGERNALNLMARAAGIGTNNNISHRFVGPPCAY